MSNNSVKPIKCGHCLNISTMKHNGSVSVTMEEVRDELGMGYDIEQVYEVLQCPACNEVTIRTYTWVDHMEEDEVAVPFTYLYPQNRKVPDGLPQEIKKSYELAQKVRTVDANAYAVLVGRVLELVCADQNAEGRDLYHKLSDLANKGIIPSKLVDVAQKLRDLRNVGAHAVLGELTQEEIPVLDDLINALLEYVYSAPHLVQRAESKLKRIKK